MTRKSGDLPECSPGPDAGRVEGSGPSVVVALASPSAERFLQRQFDKKWAPILRAEMRESFADFRGDGT